MSSRALSFATVLILGVGMADADRAQAQNLEAGKSPSQIFAQTCNACHKSPRGLLRTIAPGSLPGFLRQHYTTSSDMAGVLASYLVSNGAADSRYQAREGRKDARDKDGISNPAQGSDRQGRRQRAQEGTRPEGEAVAPSSDSARSKRLAHPGEDGARAGVAPEAAAEHPESRKTKRSGRRNRPELEQSPKVDTATPSSNDNKGELKSESKPELKPEPESKSEAKSEVKSEVKPEAKSEPSLPVRNEPDEQPKVEPGRDVSSEKSSSEKAGEATSSGASANPGVNGSPHGRADAMPAPTISNTAAKAAGSPPSGPSAGASSSDDRVDSDDSGPGASAEAPRPGGAPPISR